VPVIRALLIAGVGARLLLLGAVLLVNPRVESFLVLDAPRFVTEARNVLAHGVLSQSATPPITPTMFDVPAYPLLLAGLLGVFGPRAGVVAALVVNIVSFALTVGLLYALVRRRHGERAALRAAALLTVVPTTFFYVLVPMPDVLFLLPFMAFLLFLEAHLARGRRRDLALAAAALALAILVKPIGAGFVLLGALALLAAHGRRAAAPVALFAGTVLLIVSPWVARNYVVFGAATLTNVADATLYKEYVQMASRLRGLPPEQVMTAEVLELRARYDTEFHSVPAPELARLRRQASEGMRGHWVFYFMRVHLRNAYQFLGAGTSGFFRLFGVDLAPRLAEVARERGLRAALARVARDRELTAYVLLQSAATAVVVAVFALGAAGLIRSATRLDVRGLWLPLTGIAYLVGMTGPFSNSRYALPILPFVLMLAAGVLAKPVGGRP